MTQQKMSLIEKIHYAKILIRELLKILTLSMLIFNIHLHTTIIINYDIILLIIYNSRAQQTIFSSNIKKEL